MKENKKDKEEDWCDLPDWRTDFFEEPEEEDDGWPGGDYWSDWTD